MFTGIIETIGTIQDISSEGTNKTFIVNSTISDSLKVDQSLSHNGVCLTVERCDTHSHEVTMIHETLARTNLNACKKGDRVNLERCVKVSDRLDGHIVQGHVDTILRCDEIVNLNGSWNFHFALPPEFSPLVVMKGSICINGISLTISSLSATHVGVSIIPYTFNETTMSSLKTGDYVNVEFDILGKYVQRQHAFHVTK